MPQRSLSSPSDAHAVAWDVPGQLSVCKLGRQAAAAGCCIVPATTGHLKAYGNTECDVLKQRHFMSSTRTKKPRTEYS